MKYIKFGYSCDVVTTSHQTFDANVNKAVGSVQNPNPYGGSFFDSPMQMATADDGAGTVITSIPSPYARMHLTSNAFHEYVCGDKILPVNEIIKKKLSPDYKRALSHCLDMFEMLFHLSAVDIESKGIKVYSLPLSKPDSIASLGSENLTSYVSTLDLFRKKYVDYFRRNCPNYHFNFSSLYVFEADNKIFGATSPFTGFFTTSDCDLARKNIIITNPDNGEKHKLLTSDPKDWKGLKERSAEFRKFLYLLLKDNPTGLGRAFPQLFKAVSFYIENFDKKTAAYTALHLYREYPQFNFGSNGLPRLKENLYLRPDGMEQSYFKYLLYLYEPVDFSIPRDQYDLPLDSRKFPDNSNNFVQWIGVNDILTDNLFVLPYEINENYSAVEFYDEESNRKYRQCLLPVQAKALEWFDDIDNLYRNIEIRRYSPASDGSEHFSVVLKVDLENGGVVNLRKDYRTNNHYPDGFLMCQPKFNGSFSFGAYPFLKSNVYDNIYSVLFYSYRSDFELVFYHFDQGRALPFLAASVSKQITNEPNDDIPVSCTYYNVHESTHAIDIVELVLSSGQSSQSIGLIRPLLRPFVSNGQNVVVSVDLGTSNTVVSYCENTQTPNGVPDIKQINTDHSSGGNHWREFMTMNRSCARECPAYNPKNQYDLIIYNNTFNNKVGSESDEMLANQLTEFMPTDISPESGYKFPIPSVVNIHRRDGAVVQDLAQLGNVIPHLTSSIPFAYYERGDRNIGEAKYDQMINGSKFKWFFFRRNNGQMAQDTNLRYAFSAFLSELLFIVRSHLLCSGYPLDGCKFIWTYPLSFSDQLKQSYINIWENLCKKYFPANINVSMTNESFSPIFYCHESGAAFNGCLMLLMDVGGGSTDIIGFRRMAPEFLSSFCFAGNSLYLKGRNNSSDFRKNIIDYFLRNDNELADFFSSSVGSRTRKINLDNDLAEVMNYGFSSDRSALFSGIFKYQDSANFLLNFHNASLAYHTAQLCKMKSPNEAPSLIYLAGNGSKIFEMNNSYKSLIKKAFEYVYDTSLTMEIKSSNNPKLATSYGALMGNAQNLLFEEEAKRTVMVGDASTSFDIDLTEPDVSLVENDIDLLIKNTQQNVKDFIEFFYSSKICGTHPSVEKAILISDFEKYVSKAVDFSRDYLSDTYFFNYITILMERISEHCYEKLKTL